MLVACIPPPKVSEAVPVSPRDNRRSLDDAEAKPVGEEAKTAGEEGESKQGNVATDDAPNAVELSEAKEADRASGAGPAAAKATGEEEEEVVDSGAQDAAASRPAT